VNTIADERYVEREIMNICSRLIEDLTIIEEYLDVDANNLDVSKIILNDLRLAEFQILQSRLNLKAICPTSINKLEII
jgi:hypothetical protein